jgi:hypothetical protein
MAIGLVIYFAYSYSHSNLASAGEADANVEVPASYTPPIAAIIAIVLCIALTLYQVPYLMDLKAEVIPLNLGIRLFAWIVTGILVAVLMYGKGDRSVGRSQKVKQIGLIGSLINLAIWAGITYWFFVHFAELHVK